MSPRKPTDLHVHFGRGASYLIIQNLGANLVVVAGFVVLARLISTKEMGIYAILNLVNFGCLAFFTWFPQAVSKFVAEYISKGQRSAAAGAFYQSLRANIIIYLPVVAAMYLFAAPLASHLLGDASYAMLFRLLALDIFFNPCIYFIVVQALLALGMFRETALVGLGVGGFLRQFLIISLILLMRNFAGLVVGWLISDSATVVLYLVFAIRKLGPPRFDFPLSKLFHYYLPIEFASIAGYGQSYFDRALLAVFVPLATLGIYNAALTAFGMLTGLTTVIGYVLLPAYSSIDSKPSGGGRGSTLSAVNLATRYTSLTLIPLAFGLLAVAKPALTLFVGEAYVGGSLPLAVICGALAITAFSQALAPLFLALEETKLSATITGSTVLVSLLVAYILLPKFGVIGAASARALQMVLSAILVVLVLRRKVTLRLDFGMIAKTSFAGAVMAGVISITEVFRYSKWLLPAYMLIGVVAYLIMLRGLRVVDPSDIELLRSLMGARMSAIANILGRALLIRPRAARSACNSCGYGNQPDAMFCSYCGISLHPSGRSSELRK